MEFRFRPASVLYRRSSDVPAACWNC